MNNEMGLSLADLLIYIRTQLLDAKAAHDDKTLEYLGKALDVIQEFAYQKQDKKIALITEDFTDAIRDYFMGVEWKSTIPSEDEIRQLLK
jgi:hypothetical protein